MKLTVENRRRKGLLPEVALLSKMRSSLAVGAPEPTFPFASFQYDMSVSAALPAACVPVFFAGLECHSVLPQTVPQQRPAMKSAIDLCNHFC